MTTSDQGAPYLDDPTPLTAATSATSPVGVSPLAHARAQARRDLDERRLAELAERLGIGAPVAAKLEATARDLATLTSAPPDTILEAFGKALAPDSTRGPGMPLRLRGEPYRAHPHDDGRPGYRLTPDRRQRHQDRTAGPIARPRPPRFLTRTHLAGGCHPAFMLWCMTAAGDLR